MKRNSTILIIGGMGPWASLYFHKKILNVCKELKNPLSNDDYLSIFHISINTPDFIDSSVLEAKASLEYIKAKLGAINMDNIDLGFIMCNTAHYFFNDINKICNNKLISLVDLAKEGVSTKNVGVLATPFTLSNNLYKSDRYRIIDSVKIRKCVEGIIKKVISGEDNIDLEDDLISNVIKMKSFGAEQIIIGCSELSMLNTNRFKSKLMDFGLSSDFIIDPVDLAINKIRNSLR